MNSSRILIDFIVEDLNNGQTFKKICLSYAWATFHIKTDSAEEVYQELCLRALSRNRYAPEKGEPRGYLLQAYRNLCRIHLRKKKRKKETLESSLVNPSEEGSSFFDYARTSDESLSPLNKVIRQEDLKRIYETMIKKLSKRKLSVLTKRLEGKTYQEIAWETNRTPQSVKSGVHYSMEKLRGTLRK